MKKPKNVKKKCCEMSKRSENVYKKQIFNENNVDIEINWKSRKESNEKDENFEHFLKGLDVTNALL